MCKGCVCSVSYEYCVCVRCIFCIRFVYSVRGLFITWGVNVERDVYV